MQGEGEMEGVGEGGGGGEGGDREIGRNRRAVPKGKLRDGLSSYQADWLVDEEGDWQEEGDEEGEGEETDNVSLAGSLLLNPKKSQVKGGAGLVGMAVSRREKGAGGLSELIEREKEEMTFPDEVDSPEDQSVRSRFARYRYLQSLRSSPWDPYEGLPPSYSKIFRFEHFNNAQRRVLSEVERAANQQTRLDLALVLEKKEKVKAKTKEKRREYQERRKQGRGGRVSMEENEEGEEGEEGETGSSTPSQCFVLPPLHEEEEEEEDGDEKEEMSEGDSEEEDGEEEGEEEDDEMATGQEWAGEGKGKGRGDVYVRSGSYVIITIASLPLDIPFLLGLQAISPSLSLSSTSSLSFPALSFPISLPFPLPVYSLLKHENKLSVVHYNIQRIPPQTPSSSSSLSPSALASLPPSLTHPPVEGTLGGIEFGTSFPIKTKDTLLFQVGFRSFLSRPVFSEPGLHADKHKGSRFLLPGEMSVASCLAPISFAPCPVLVYKLVPSSSVPASSAPSPFFSTLSPSPHLVPVLVASGSVGEVNPNKIVLKKVMLSGVPLKVRRKTAIIRSLFFDPLDVRWYKPAELYTKHGIRGVIKEPVGTHGLFKAQFASPITQNDTVLLILYKRVFPKFPSPLSLEGLPLKDEADSSALVVR